MHDPHRHHCRNARRAEAARARLAAQQPQWHPTSGPSARREDEWIAACAGAGQAAATRAFAAIEDGGPIDLVFSIGWAGALTPEIAPGTAHNMAGVIDAHTGERFRCDAGAGELWLATSPKVADQAEKRRLAAAYKAALVDMEAAAVARLAAMREIPFYCIKGVSDGLDDRLPDFNRFHRRARPVPYRPFRPFCASAPHATGPHSSGWAKIVNRLPKALRSRCSIFSPERGHIRKRHGYPNLEPGNSGRAPPFPATMRAVVYRGINDMRVETVPVPRIGAGELLIKVATCGICGTDLKKIHMGSHSAPRIFGHEMAGVIVETGAGRHRLRGGRSRHDLPPRALRRVLLLPQADPRAVPALQEDRRHGGL